MRGFTPWPGAYTTLRGQQLQVLRARVIPASAGAQVSHGEPGTMSTDKRRFTWPAADNSALELLEIQLPGKNRMAVGSFLNGYSIAPDEMLGERP